jgi:hypothetical protein
MGDELTWDDWQKARVRHDEANQLAGVVPGTWRPTTLDPIDDHMREVFANAGLAFYLAQVLEHGLVNLVAAARAADGSYATPDDVDDTIAQLFGKTMGGQLRAALEAVLFTPAQTEKLERALAARNQLAHHFFRERADDLGSEEGRNRLLAELNEMQEQFQSIERELEPYLWSLFSKSGITREMFERGFEQLNADTSRG